MQFGLSSEHVKLNKAILRKTIIFDHDWFSLVFILFITEAESALSRPEGQWRKLQLEGAPSNHPRLNVDMPMESTKVCISTVKPTAADCEKNDGFSQNSNFRAHQLKLV